MEPKFGLVYQWGQGSPFSRGLHPSKNLHSWPFEVARLLSEKEVLDIGLANCVTYLHALRKKQARNERRLSTNPTLPRRKRKKIQQSKRELEREIKNREQDEQAFLNNLQACQANIYIAQTMSQPPTQVLPSVVDYHSNSIAEASEQTEISWNGWTDDAVVSPFHKPRNSPFFSNEIAPDEGFDGMAGRGGPLAPIRCFEENSTSLAAPPNAARSQFLYSMLSPEAAVFDPHVTYTSRNDALIGHGLGGHGSPAPRGIESPQHRRVTYAAASHGLTQLSQPDPGVRGHTWSNANLQASATGETRNSRTRSL
ncbi:hypothetical protein BKA66DRAFT_476466 [Pyrenochaeta sp. MPI-SDFR-AT-0127]|nr:hypothetical protein BKA66DRAFT_476466 [Pyrenochaeta sp. MPI-SDFR-AT-0127]